MCVPHNEVHKSALLFVMGNGSVLYTDTQWDQPTQSHNSDTAGGLTLYGVLFIQTALS